MSKLEKLDEELIQIFDEISTKCEKENDNPIITLNYMSQLSMILRIRTLVIELIQEEEKGEKI